MPRSMKMTVGLAMILGVSGGAAHLKGQTMDTLTAKTRLSGFATQAVYEGENGRVVGSRFHHDSGFIVDLLRIQTLPQAFVWVNIPPPSDQGTLVYLNGGDDLSPALGRVGPAGGEVLAEKFRIGEAGFIAYFRDPEGHKVALHSLK